jgi:hypothetical protein
MTALLSAFLCVTAWAAVHPPALVLPGFAQQLVLSPSRGWVAYFGRGTYLTSKLHVYSTATGSGDILPNATLYSWTPAHDLLLHLDTYGSTGQDVRLYDPSNRRDRRITGKFNSHGGFTGVAGLDPTHAVVIWFDNAALQQRLCVVVSGRERRCRNLDVDALFSVASLRDDAFVLIRQPKGTNNQEIQVIGAASLEPTATYDLPGNRTLVATAPAPSPRDLLVVSYNSDDALLFTHLVDGTATTEERLNASDPCGMAAHAAVSYTAAEVRQTGDGWRVLAPTSWFGGLVTLTVREGSVSCSRDHP